MNDFDSIWDGVVAGVNAYREAKDEQTAPAATATGSTGLIILVIAVAAVVYFMD